MKMLGKISHRKSSHRLPMEPAQRVDSTSTNIPARWLDDGQFKVSAHMSQDRMPMDESESISPLESFHLAFRTFIDAVDTLAADSAIQCEWTGDFNVAWELKDDISSGRFLVGQGLLSQPEELCIDELIEALNSIPASVLTSASGRDANLEAMSHPSWIPIRAKAADVLTCLHEFSIANGQFLGLSARAL